MTITLVGSDLGWLREIYERTLSGDRRLRLPEADRMKLLSLDLIDEESGSIQVTPKGHEELKRHRV